MDAQMYNSLKTKFDSSASTPVVEEHLNDLVGLGPASHDDLLHCGLREVPGPLRVADLLREWNDGTIALEPRVRRLMYDMGETPDGESKQGNWERDVGLKEETSYVVIYPAQQHAETWMQEAEEKGYSCSQYLIQLIQEVRAKREGRLSALDTNEKRVEELTRTIEQLEADLEAARESLSSPQPPRRTQPRTTIDESIPAHRRPR